VFFILLGKKEKITLVFGAVWLAILPVLLLIWLNRQDIKEDMINGYGWKYLGVNIINIIISIFLFAFGFRVNYIIS